jgi:hypothetical protein
MYLENRTSPKVYFASILIYQYKQKQDKIAQKNMWLLDHWNYVHAKYALTFLFVVEVVIIISDLFFRNKNL